MSRKWEVFRALWGAATLIVWFIVFGGHAGDGLTTVAMILAAGTVGYLGYRMIVDTEDVAVSELKTSTEYRGELFDEKKEREKYRYWRSYSVMHGVKGVAMCLMLLFFAVMWTIKRLG
jgi:hypothetical protein